MTYSACAKPLHMRFLLVHRGLTKNTTGQRIFISPLAGCRDQYPKSGEVAGQRPILEMQDREPEGQTGSGAFLIRAIHGPQPTDGLKSFQISCPADLSMVRYLYEQRMNNHYLRMPKSSCGSLK